ncbi:MULTISPECIES: hypothetical protein [unclassified Tolypothrix]|uniref:hypothetical protein n=1 Tax=unclassified Tolypothrix TaxID=2649714 RepID=UPI0005EAC0A9|nr:MULTISPECIES: hypothetical protein [unclassified Tolypothrix]BAY90630.1 hypothetical protein NIES3275_26470 [Microchaete diplosiphon NIES-3275]EKF01204.1 hypothetical protein FDUTEX481_08084 [Tolypothrix sp. PCC 7601]MBE9087112.1 hypothetical protein [Tolypothrix sp. LEGE 11397]UYD24783.1 hypothetical protein HGR01_25650 [Tolypothrix sp. PCC 7712]UYD32986.1 hypothetical protein HG267_29000 [Tolypothrix sp. PCC 7601]
MLISLQNLDITAGKGLYRISLKIAGEVPGDEETGILDFRLKPHPKDARGLANAALSQIQN